MASPAALALLFLLVLFSLHYSTNAQRPQTVADVQIVSVSGCVDQYPVTVNCSVGVTTLLVQTAAGFPSSIDFSEQLWYLAVNAHINDFNYFIVSTPWLNAADPSNSSVYINVTAGAYYPHITQQLVSLSFVDNYVGSPSAPFAGFSYHFEGPPTLASVSGCDGGGQSTLNCVPDSAILTLTGSGFLWYSSNRQYSGPYGVALSIGNETGMAYYTRLQVANDSYATLSLVSVYSTLLKPQHYAGVLLPFSFTSTYISRSGAQEFSFSTNSLQISFVPLPPPRVSQWSVTSCNQTYPRTNLTRYTACLASVSVLTVYGGYLYDVRVTVGGVPCVVPFPNAANLQCTLPDFDFDPSTAYDVVIHSDGGNTTLSGLVQYSSAPTLISIDPCIDRGEAYVQAFTTGVQCPIGTTLTLRGSRFSPTDAVAVQFTVSFSDPPVDVELLSPVVLNSTTMTVTLPEVNASAIEDNLRFGRVQVAFTTAANITTTTNPLYNSLYLPLNSPNITSVSSSSCDSLSPLQLTNCRAMAVITVAGTNLQKGNEFFFATSIEGTLLSPWDYLLPSNSSIDFVSNTSLVLTLDYFDAYTNVQLQPDVVYTMAAITEVGPYRWHYSNAFRLSLTYRMADINPPTSLSSQLSSGAIAGIVIAAVLVALLLVLAVAWLVRRQLSSKQQARGEMQWAMRGGGQSSSEDYKDVELH